ncbi:MAG TPA: AI-2E family transporter, partial [Paludibacteraceae bacterium]|nr:AI-2E family transporter [Paludibacteraceae bacterium]
LLQPVVHFFQYTLKFKFRILAVISTLTLFFGAIIGVLWIIIPIASNEIQAISNTISLYVQGINMDTVLPETWQKEIRMFLSQLNIQSILDNESLMSVIKNSTPRLWLFINNSFSFILGFSVIFIVLLYIVFILKDYEKITTQWIQIVPTKYRGITTEIISDIEKGMNRYFRGQFLIALTVGTLFTIGFSIIGLPLAILFGIFVGILNLVPYLQIIAVVPALFLVFLQSIETNQSFGACLLGLLIVFAIVQGLQDLVLVPKIMGKVTGLNPAIILLSLSIWGALLGIVGMILALPMTTLLISYYKRFVINKETLTETSEITKEEAKEETIGNNSINII